MIKSFLIVLSILSSVFVAQAQSSASLPYYDPTWSKPYEPFRIAGNVYYVGTYDLACYLITTPEGHILINSGLAESAAMIRKSVETLGFRFSDIKILLTTQAHYDHVAGLAQIQKETGAKMMVNEADAQVLADGGSSDFIFGGKGSMFTPVKADRLLHDGDTVKLGGTKLLVLHHPGHTKGSTSFMLDVKDEKRSWKVLIVNIPSILSQTRISGMPAYPNVGKDYDYTLKSLRKLQFDLWVASHAGQFGLHDKRKEGDAYRPEIFNDRPAFEASINSVQLDYNKRLKSERSK
ncbi:subclass B3 metallo-beta-lactamase [Fulvivirgaceae bacterium PWU4]|uniref:Subclass B3 metallo-beta-lactamase n=1 Tax=Chryseosolibacter histidini TaxID=2782349 RepID=A0AAP2DRU9_9BACT|nr:subclass B3 metallo-beta-lactamase [Chryseosolibacter histidini]MBT1701328.1 subclass B3 metallo-beta-lactamase [Chryseosolibacter histidini]